MAGRANKAAVRSTGRRPHGMGYARAGDSVLHRTIRPGSRHAEADILPVMTDANGQPESAPKPLTGRVLVVDDDAAIRRLYGRWLSALGFRMVEAEGGRLAVDLYAEDAEGFDLVILDMIMPDVSGFHTFELLRKADPDAKVLLCSGYTVDRQAAIILEAGAVGFLQKPFTRDSLLQALQRALGPHTAQPDPHGA